MQILVQQGPERVIALASESFALLLKYVPPKDKTHPVCTIEMVPKSYLKKQKFEKLSKLDIHGFIGLIELEGSIFIGTITGKSEVASPIPGETVNKIYGVDFFCLDNNQWDFVEFDSNGFPIIPEEEYASSSNQQQQHPCHDLKKLLSNGSFYYSSDFDLTSLLQSRGLNQHSLSFDNYQEEYMWNSFLMQEIITFRNHLDDKAKQIMDDEGFLTTVIRGFAETFPSYIGRMPVNLTMISKQSWKRAGTRFNVRGIDDEANVANFCETEFIMYSEEYCFAVTEIRGSVPVFWEQDTALINPKVTITRSVEATQSTFDEHFKRLIQKYGPVHVVNLLSTKSSEIELTRRYREHFERSKSLKLNSEIFLTEFDFHKETKEEGFAAASKIMPKLERSILENGYFSYDVKEKKQLSEQNGVFRTNCLDCLDRTNLIQQFISRYTFILFLEDFQLIKPKLPLIEEYDWYQKHNNIWADHGDAVSQIYTGTNALKSSFSRKGKMSFAGALSDATKSVSRMYINNFMDKNKQMNIDALLGRLPHQHSVELFDPINDYVNEELRKQEAQFTTSSNIKILCGTFNVNGLTKSVDLSEWLYPIGKRYLPDIVVLGLQEVIELNASSILNVDTSKSQFWKDLVHSCLNKHENYIMLRAEQMSSLIILFFVKADKVGNVKRVEGSSKKTGLGGMTGNKGAVAIRFDYGSTSFCFINAHLSAGVNNVEERRSDYESITKGISFSRSKRIDHHNSTFWLGDLNYRIELPNEKVRSILSLSDNADLDKLLEHDQLTLEMASESVFKGFMEPSIQFRPTYKYDHGTDRYDTSEKARIPSWTDRILYKGENLQPMAYSDAKLNLSDHKPVYAAYKAKVKFIDEESKIQMTKKLYMDYKQSHPQDSGSINSALLDLELVDAKEEPKPVISTEMSLLDLDLHFESAGVSTSRGMPPKPLSPSSRSSSSISSLSLTSPPVGPTARRGDTVRNGAQLTKEPEAVRRVPPPPPHKKPVITLDSPVRTPSPSSISTSASDRKITLVPPPPPSRKPNPPPGFSDVILTPKGSTPEPVVSPPVPIDSAESSAKKSKPHVPSKKPELAMSLDSWKPLQPK
ncbi:Inp53/Inp52 [Kluyveromyces lactis]|nr:Inp53/Inp52 [Kluyveromyces lactis]